MKTLVWTTEAIKKMKFCTKKKNKGYKGEIIEVQ